VTKLVFYHDHAAKSREAAEQVRAFCRERGLAAKAIALDAFDIIQCAKAMRADLRKEGAENVVFNITGGTPVISAAATLACILEGVRAVYIDERSQKEVRLPLLSLRYEEILNEPQRRVLRFVSEKGAKGCDQAEIMRALKLSRGTVSHHVTNLKAKQLLSSEADPKDARRETLRVRESAALLLMGP